MIDFVEYFHCAYYVLCRERRLLSSLSRVVNRRIGMSIRGPKEEHVLTKRGERRVFLFITVFLFPALSIILIGGYGFLIWILQIIFGPPTSG
jgi:nitrate reductase NapE